MNHGCAWWIAIGWWWEPINAIRKSSNKRKAKKDFKNFEKSIKEKEQQQNQYFEQQNAMLQRISDAKWEYQQDKDINKLISVYELVFINSNPPLQSSQDLDLADLYIKADMHNKAWGYLNSLLLRGNTPPNKIYYEQARILKKENKYEQAAYTYMLCHLSKAQRDGIFHPEPFIKDVKVCANKLKWDDSKINKLVEILQTKVKNRDYNPNSLSQQFKNATQEV